MAVEILQSKTDNKSARHEMRVTGMDCTAPLLLRLARRTGLVKGINVGEHCKSWDVLKAVRFIKTTLMLDAPILDIGAYASEILCSLHRLGFSNLTGIDLNPDLKSMPNAATINYIIGDFMHMPFLDSSFAAVTAISVIEHGLQGDALLAELSRVLKPGGYFIASVDYWPEKINTDGIKAFGMDWRIFSRDELVAFLDLARKYGFSPVGDISLSASEPTVFWQGKRYTFAWIAIRKDR
jgi:SAM-dependent methyltransferase